MTDNGNGAPQYYDEYEIDLRELYSPLTELEKKFESDIL
ncbi:hypothetical protein Halsa_0571 [Halanaerobium hydrogeniformans]|uniref:Uncharacterized protein n=1 Tax=Halanaerobium hydrogeniformans TaxID=656519 RepID=E4RPL3_HALHG|nr:hypothetical protein Halsa_0571 [Halanaerobium hydrogeniformans]